LSSWMMAATSASKAPCPAAAALTPASRPSPQSLSMRCRGAPHNCECASIGMARRWMQSFPIRFQTKGRPIFQAQGLPQTRDVEGARFILKKVSLRKVLTMRDGDEREEYRLEPIYEVSIAGLPKATFDYSVQLFDPTGNTTLGTALPAADRVWGLRVAAKESREFPFPPERGRTLVKAKAPGPGQAILVPVLPELSAVGVTDMFVLGPGEYRWNGGTLKGGVPGTMANNPLGKVSQRRWGSESTNTVVLYFFSTENQPLEKLGAFLRVRSAGEAANHQSSGMSSAGDGYQHQFGHYTTRGGTRVQPGDDLEIELVIPKTRTAEFYFERPKLPGE
jgi:hypothetical protein